MPKTVNSSTLQIKIDNQLRDDAKKLYEGLGLSLTEAIRLFLKQSVNQGTLPIKNIVSRPEFSNLPIEYLSIEDAQGVIESRKEIEEGKFEKYNSTKFLSEVLK